MASVLRIDTRRARMEHSCLWVFFFLFAAVWVAVLLLLVFRDFRIYSDNYYYSDVYDHLGSSSLLDGYGYYVWGTAATEPATYLLMFASSRVMTYDFFVYVTGVLLFCSFAAFLLRQGVSPLVVLLFLATNYYLVVMTIGVHRVKIAFTVYLMILLTQSRRRRTLSLLPPLFHFQLFAFPTAFFAGSVVESVIRGKVSPKTVLAFFVLLALALILAANTGLYVKFIGRAGLHFGDFFVAAALVVLFILYFNVHWITDIISLAVIALFVGILGGFRMNMILYFTFAILLAQRRPRRFAELAVISALYFAGKTYQLYAGHYLDNLIR